MAAVAAASFSIKDFFKSFLLVELVKGMALTGRYAFRSKVTVQFPEENRSVEDQILKKIECEQLHKFLLELSKEEQWLIQELYFEERTEREVASVLGLSQKAINKRRQKILEKLRKLF